MNAHKPKPDVKPNTYIKSVPETERIMKNKNRTKTVLNYALLLFISVLMVGPFVWLLATALKSGSENIFAYPPKFIPEDLTFANFPAAMEAFPFWKYLWNSTVVAVFTVLLNIIFCSMAAYPLARMKFRGKNVMFILILSTMMIPFQLLMIPVYILSLDLGLKNTYAGLILPHATTAFGVFLMRQSFLSIPYELDESAKMDGANSFQIFWRILMPLVKPSMVTLAIFTFVMAWGDFLWPLIILDDQSMYTLPLGLQTLTGLFSANWRLIAAGAILSIIPIITVFIILQRYFIAGATKGAVKG
ncbi:carbohydrate ABC transporter permease [Alkalihalobacillus sp. AL-G]|uniref:carbohydrate ABC transporter permease n=1 Tax=Alkalihalobacillus sp. AL-G TaxID=2926399 RepID=UPI00272C5715|nr:carbohydrate ABC transporter permease [Alkalihalobacillus sp. AL-G]WLD93069.1 carbohydrate ABC transporter permease [Alkalihalobacillus sp. AL-G]